MATSPGSEEEVEGLDEEFLHHLSRGSDLLTRGNLADAIHSLQRAAQLRPKDVKVAGLLGQACYRGGRYEEAAAAYGRLVEQSPTEVAAPIALTPQEAALVAANFMGRTDLYSVEVAVWNGMNVYKVTFSSGDVVYVSMDGQVLGNEPPQTVFVSSNTDGGGNTVNRSSSHEESESHEGHDDD